MDPEHVVLISQHRREVHAPAVPVEVRIGGEARRRAGRAVAHVEAGLVFAQVCVGARVVHRGRPLVVLGKGVREPQLGAVGGVKGVHPTVGPAVDVDLSVVDGRGEVTLPLRRMRGLEDHGPGGAVKGAQPRVAAVIAGLDVGIAVGITRGVDREDVAEVLRPQGVAVGGVKREKARHAVEVEQQAYEHLAVAGGDRVEGVDTADVLLPSEGELRRVEVDRKEAGVPGVPLEHRPGIVAAHRSRRARRLRVFAECRTRVRDHRRLGRRWRGPPGDVGASVTRQDADDVALTILDLSAFGRGHGRLGREDSRRDQDGGTPGGRRCHAHFAAPRSN